MDRDFIRGEMYVFLALAVSTVACAGGGSGDAASVQAPAPAGAADPTRDETAEPPPAPIREAGRVILHTTEGPITITFFPDVAPRTSSHIMDLLQAGCYDGVEFHRLEPNFVVQLLPVADKTCHPDALATVPAEFSGASHKRLSLSLARFEDPDSGTSSWSIVLGDVPAMDGEYAVFGRVIEGEAAVQKIEAVGSTKGEDGMGRPNRKISIERAEVVEPL